MSVRGRSRKRRRYRGPTYRGTIDEGRWIADEESYGITGSTHHPLFVGRWGLGERGHRRRERELRGRRRIPRFLITWKLVKEGGRWKLDEQLSAQRSG